jgi:hypothetical protein
MKSISDKQMGHDANLTFPQPELKGINSNTAEVPTALRDLIFEGEMIAHLEELESTGAIALPRVVATMVSTRNPALLSSLAVYDPSIGAAIIYGGIVCGDDELCDRAYNAAADLIAEYLDYGSQIPPPLSREALSFFVQVVKKAEEIRPTDEGIFHKDRYHGILSGLNDSITLVDPAHYQADDIFRRITSDVDTIHEAMKGGSVPDGAFFSDPTPSLENYMRAVYAASAERGSALEKAGIDYLARLDAPLQKCLPRSGKRSHPL